MSLTPQNPVLTCLAIDGSDRIVSIRESGNVDSNFVVTHLMKQIFQDEHHLCLVVLHNTFGHYQNVGKRLGFDLVKKVEEKRACVLEPLKDLVANIGETTSCCKDDNPELVVRSLFENIQKSIRSSLLSSNKVYLIIDDISHLLDLGLDLKFVIVFTNYIVSLVNDDRVNIVINTHVCGKSDEIVANNLNYISDVCVEVVPLKTGFSREVTGLMSVEKGRKLSRYHFKTFDKGVKTFHLGESLYNLYK